MTLQQTDHAHYGEVIKTPDGKIVCHICGRAFVKLGAHIVQKHGMTSRQYKQMFGLDVGKGLITTDHRQHLHDCVMRNYAVVVNKNLVELGESTRFVLGSAGRGKDMLSEQSRRRIANRNSAK